MKLTSDNVRTLPVKGADVLYPDDACENFYLRVRAGGSRTYCIQWRQGRLQRRATIGKVSHLPLDEARQRARKLLVGVYDGVDPIAQKAKAVVSDRQLFGVLATEYLEVRTRDMRPRSLDQCRMHLQKYFKPMHRMALNQIDRAAVAAELRIIARERGPVAANRGRSSLSAFFGWCIGEGILESNPTLGTNKQAEGGGRDRVLTDDELVAIWNACRDDDYGRIVKLLMLTGQRREEIASLKWSEVPDGAIMLPKERTKNGRAHVVPLAINARAVLYEAPERVGSEFVFGAGKTGFNNFSKSKQQLDKACGVTGFTLHDLRRTAASGMARLGVSLPVIEKILNHTSGSFAGVVGVYQRHDFAAEKFSALTLWDAHVANIVRIQLARATGTNVTTLKRALGGAV